MAVLTPTPQVAPKPARRGLGERCYTGLEVVAGIVAIAGGSIACWFTPPLNWWRESVDQAWILIKRCLLPVGISTFAFGYGAAGIQGGLTFELAGNSVDRLGSLFAVGTLRELSPWVTGMVMAGAAGTAIAADLGARKVREELDALAVMGVDPIRALIAPRVLALTLLMPAINMVGIVLGTLGGLLAEFTFHGTAGGFFATFQAALNSTDLYANVIKTLVFGFIIAVVSSYKGMNAEGGSEGVGRAVNQAVVIAFVALWVFNYAFNASYEAIFPAAQQIR